MNLIFCDLKKAKKHGYDFLQSEKAVKKHEFNFLRD